MENPLVILDADGVFLDERCYWDTALRTALSLNRLPVPAGDAWRALTETAFGRLGLQRVTKSRGCNSNHDLAAVLFVAMQDRVTWETTERALRDADWGLAVSTMVYACDVQRRFGKAMDDLTDPIEAFGVRRDGAAFSVVCATFQSFLESSHLAAAEVSDMFCGGVDAVRDALTTLRDMGCTLVVCTGRDEAELMRPLDAVGLGDAFATDRTVTADVVESAEVQTSVGPLGKPHWFPVVCATFGREAAMRALRDGELSNDMNRRVVYVGDGVSDFAAVRRARAIGLDVAFVLVRSGATGDADREMIADQSFTLGVVDALTEVPMLLASVEVAS